MEIIKCNKKYTYSINFIDENDVFVGYYMESFCWAIRLEDGTWLQEDDLTEADKERLKSYVFDPEFFEEIENCERSGTEEGEPSGAQARFRLIGGYKGTMGFPGSKREILLVLANYHNGYYSHGFEMKNRGKVVRRGAL